MIVPRPAQPCHAAARVPRKGGGRRLSLALATLAPALLLVQGGCGGGGGGGGGPAGPHGALRTGDGHFLARAGHAGHDW